MAAVRSLELINRYIEQSRKDASNSIGVPLLKWGVLVIITSAIVGLLWYATGSTAWNLLWAMMALIGWLSGRIVHRRSIDKPFARTFVDTVVAYIWKTFFIMCGITFVLGWISMDADYSAQQLPITAVILIIMCFAMVVTGLVLRNNFINMMVGAQVINVCFSLRFPGPDEMIFMGLAGLVALVLPGLVIIGKNKRHDGE